MIRVILLTFLLTGCSTLDTGLPNPYDWCKNNPTTLECTGD